MPPNLLRLPLRVGVWIVAMFVAVGLLLSRAAEASAAITLSTGYPIRADGARSALIANEKTATHGINRGNCESQELWTFRFTISSEFVGQYDTLRIFAQSGEGGPSCELTESRLGVTPTCHLVARFQSTVVQNEGQVYLTATQMMVAAGAASAAVDVAITDDGSKSKNTASNVDPNKACFPTASMVPAKLYLKAVLFKSETAVTGSELATYFTTWDLMGPSLPGSLGVGAGNGIIVANWGTSSTNAADLKGYQAYCFPDPNYKGDVDASTEAAALDASAEADAFDVVDTSEEADTTDSFESSTDAHPSDTEEAAALVDVFDASEASVDADSGAVSDAAEAETTAADTYVAPVIPANCPSGVPFVQGQLPTTALDVYKCGGIFTTTSGKSTISGLTNNRNYAIAIAAVDNYGNTGLLSNVACDMPRETVDFYRAYVDAGGTAGGGYCAFGRSPFASAGAGIVLLTLVGLLRRRAHRASQESRRDS